MSTIRDDGLYVIAKPMSHGGFATWRKPPRGNIGRTRYGLCHRLETGPPRHVATFGELATGVTDAGIAEFWARALRKLRKLRFDDAQRREIAHQLRARGTRSSRSSPTSSATRTSRREFVASATSNLERNEAIDGAQCG